MLLSSFMLFLRPSCCPVLISPRTPLVLSHQVSSSGAKIKRGAGLRRPGSFIRLFAHDRVAADQRLHESGAPDRNSESTGQPGKALERFLLPVNYLRQQGRRFFHVPESRRRSKPFSIPPHHPGFV